MTWRKSSFSIPQGDCLEISFTKSSYSMANGDCVETGFGDQVLVRDSKQGPSGPMLSFSPADWGRFLQELPVRPRN